MVLSQPEDKSLISFYFFGLFCFIILFYYYFLYNIHFKQIRDDLKTI